MDESKLSPSQVKAWLSQVESDLAAVADRLEPLLTEQRQLEERRMLLQSLLRSFEDAGLNGDVRSGPARTTGSVGRYVVERAVEILREEGRPMHINDLHARFIDHGFTVPGAGKPVNLIVHLRAAKEVASPMRGIYGLPDQVEGMPSTPPKTRKRKARRPRARGRAS